MWSKEGIVTRNEWKWPQNNVSREPHHLKAQQRQLDPSRFGFHHTWWSYTLKSKCVLRINIGIMPVSPSRRCNVLQVDTAAALGGTAVKELLRQHSDTSERLTNPFSHSGIWQKHWSLVSVCIGVIWFRWICVCVNATLTVTSAKELQLGRNTWALFTSLSNIPVGGFTA